MNMKKKPIFLCPLVFAFFCALVYTVVFLYSWTAEDYTTLMLVFCAGLGWGGLIYIKRGFRHWLLYGYVLVSLMIPPVYMELLGISRVDPFWHRLTFGLMILAMLVMNLLISMYLKEKKQSQQKG